MRACGGDGEFGPLILRPFEILGVERLADSGVVLRAKVTTTPKEQWRVGREYNRRIKQAFDRAGIEIPFPTVQLAAARPPAADGSGDLAGPPS
ncbi:hypothetical protein [Phenylobacterium sp. J367]|uniref:hypothetical protein n=1 Tax=Phenylobacterium sp. J367 TaxID=2898435 RepID=UPI0035B366A0